MRLTNERKLCAGVLALALTALAADRLFFAGASPVSAYAVEQSGEFAVDHPSEGVALGRDSGGLGAPVPVAAQFVVIASLAANTLDGFSLPSKWEQAIERERKLTQAKPAAAPEPVKQSDTLAADWISGRKLTSIVRYGGVAKAQISGRGVVRKGCSLGVGDQLDGFTLTDINEADGRATFTDPTGEVIAVLELPRPDGQEH